MPSHTLQKRFRPFVVEPRAGFEMPTERAPPANKKIKGGALANAAEMAVKAKAGSETVRNNEGTRAGKGKSKRAAKTHASSEGSELKESEGENSPCLNKMFLN